MNREKKLFLILFCIHNMKNPTITRIQKTLFVYSREFDENSFAYVPNHYGPNSFELKEDITFLLSHQYLSDVSEIGLTKFKTTQKSQKLLAQKNMLEKYDRETSILMQILECKELQGNKIVSYIYHWYPKYTEKSLIVDDITRKATDEWKNNADKVIKLLREKIQDSKSN